MRAGSLNSDRVDPSERRNALWMAHALLATAHPLTPVTEVGASRKARQHRLFRGQNATGLEWLVEQWRQWPAEYRQTHWIDLENVLAAA
jgi:hypothetical protein